MNVISVHLLASNAPVNGLTDDPEITIMREDGTEDVADAAMTDRGTRGKYSYAFTPTNGERYSFLIDADPNNTGQLDVRYWSGAFDGDLELAKEIAESDQVFDQTNSLLHYYRRGTGGTTQEDLIPPKNEAGALAPTDVSLVE